MLLVGNRPILKMILGQLFGEGINGAFISTLYKPKKIEKHLDVFGTKAILESVSVI